MKVIFLDFDGVLCNLESISAGYKSRTAPEQDPYGPHVDCVAALNRIVAETGAAIVVSSTWRKAHVGRSAMSERLTAWGVVGTLIGMTPILHTMRGEEIQSWLTAYRRHPVESFVILDDDSDMGAVRHRLVQTNSHAGLTEQDADKAIAILNAPPTDFLIDRMIREVQGSSI